MCLNWRGNKWFDGSLKSTFWCAVRTEHFYLGQWLIALMVERVIVNPKVWGSNRAKVHHWELEIIQPRDCYKNGGSVVGNYGWGLHLHLRLLLHLCLQWNSILHNKQAFNKQKSNWRPSHTSKMKVSLMWYLRIEKTHVLQYITLLLSKIHIINVYHLLLCDVK